MADDIITPVYQHRETKVWKKGGDACGGIYFFAFLGAVIYYFQHATTFWEGLLGFFKAIAWPAVLVYKALELLKL